MSATGIFDPESKTIKEVFGDTKSFYLMPEYQRPYSWDDERVNQLWDDLKTAFDNYTESKALNEVPPIDENYFLGSIILTPAQGGFDVVDGQQRLTTLMILFCVVRDLFPTLNDTADITVDTEAITIVDVKNSISYNNQRNRLRLFTHLNSQNDFENEIITGIKWPTKFTKADKQNKKYLNTALLFKESLTEMNAKEPASIIPFINYLFNRVRIIKITCSSQSFAIKLFQVLNTRGMDLAPADLIKSYLYGNIVNFEKDPQLIDVERKKLMQEWNSIEQMLSKTDDSITDMFNTYLYFVSHTNPRKTLYEELQPYIEKKSPTTFIYDFKQFVKNYIDVYSSKEYTTYSLRYLQHQLYWKPILTGARHLGFHDQKKLKETLSRFYYLYWIAGYTSPKIKQTSFNILKWIKGIVEFTETTKDNEFTRYLAFSNESEHNFGLDLTKTATVVSINYLPNNRDLMKAIEFKLEERLKNDGVYDKVKVNISENCYGEGWLKPLLILIEYNETQNRDYIPLDKNLHAEHIMPQSREYEYWKSSYTVPEYEVSLMKIENLTLLTGDRNIQASNRPFNLSNNISPAAEKALFFDTNLQQHVDKLFIYNGRGLDGASKFLITQEINKQWTKWDKTEMTERKKWLIVRIEKILNIKLN